VSWTGSTRSPLQNQIIYPPLEHGLLRTWVGVGGSPESVVRAARYGFDLMLAIIGGEPARFAPFVELYYQALAEFGRERLPIGCHCPGHVAETDEQAQDELWPHYFAMRKKIGAERGWPPPTREQFEREAGPTGALFVGSPDTVAAKIARTAGVLSLSRFDLKYSNGSLPHDKLMQSIELIGTRVVPRVHALMAANRATPA